MKCSCRRSVQGTAISRLLQDTELNAKQIAKLLAAPCRKAQILHYLPVIETLYREFEWLIQVATHDQIQRVAPNSHLYRYQLPDTNLIRLARTCTARQVPGCAGCMWCLNNTRSHSFTSSRGHASTSLDHSSSADLGMESRHEQQACSGPWFESVVAIDNANLPGHCGPLGRMTWRC